MRATAACAASPSAVAIRIVPSSEISIFAPVSSVIERITEPPFPITSRILSGWILSVMIRGAYCEMSSRGSAIAFCHDVEDVHAALSCLLQSFLQDHRVDAGDLDVHLQGRDAFARSGDLKVHVAVMVFGTGDVRKDRVAIPFHHQAHRNTRDRTS